jgi:cyclitol reductase
VTDIDMKLPLSFIRCSLVEGRVEAQRQDLSTFLHMESAVVIRVSKMGVCRADIKEVIGARDIPADRGPLFGHEIVGTIASNTVPGFNVPVGSAVTFNPNITPDRSAGFAEFMYVQGTADTLTECVIPLHDRSDVESSWIPEPFACIVHAVDCSPLSAITSGDSVAVIGAGCSGALFSLYCEYLGADVQIFNRGRERLEYLRDKKLSNPSKLHALSDLYGFESRFDHVVVATTKIVRSVMDSAHLLCKENGAILLYGGTQNDDSWRDTGVDIDSIRRGESSRYVEVENKGYWLTGAYGCSNRDFIKAMRLVSENGKQFPISALTNREVKFSEFPDLINRMAAGADYPGKIIVSN